MTHLKTFYHLLRGADVSENNSEKSRNTAPLVVPFALFCFIDGYGGETRCRIWLTYCATNRKVAGSSHGWVVAIFYWLIHSSHTQPLPEMSANCFSWRGGGGKKLPVDNLTSLSCRLPLNSAILNLLETSEPVQVCIGIALLFRWVRNIAEKIILQRKVDVVGELVCFNSVFVQCKYQMEQPGIQPRTPRWESTF